MQQKWTGIIVAQREPNADMPHRFTAFIKEHPEAIVEGTDIDEVKEKLRLALDLVYDAKKRLSTIEFREKEFPYVRT